MWPARPPARPALVHAGASRRGRGPRSTAGSGYPARPRLARARQPSSSPTRQSTPMTSPRHALQRQQVGGACRSGSSERGCPRARRAYAMGQARTRNSRPRRERPPTSRTPGGPALPPPPARADSRTTSASSSARALPRAGIEYMRPLSREVGGAAPSTAYDASVNGAPAKPMRGVFPPALCAAAGSLSAGAQCSRAGESAEATHRGRIAHRRRPDDGTSFPAAKWNGKPRGASSGGRSLKRIGASTPSARTAGE